MHRTQAIPWLPDIPSSWSVQPAKTVLEREKILNSDRTEQTVLSLTLRGVVENDPENPEGLVPADYATYQIFEADDLVFKLIDLENVRTSRIGHVHRKGIMSSAYLRLRPMRSVCPRYLYWQFFDLYNRRVFNQLGNGVRSTLGAEDVLTLPLAIPTLPEQRKIADYLDRETDRIDTLIAKKGQVQDLLHLRLYSLIAEEMASLEITHVPLKRTARIIDCKHRTPDYLSSGIPIVSPGDIQPGILDLSGCYRFVSEEEYRDLASGERRAAVGDIIYSRNASIGIPALVATNCQFAMGQDVCIIRPLRSDGDGRFLQLILETLGKDQLEEQKIGSTFSRINVSQIAELRIPALSEVAQDELVDQWTTERTRTTALIEMIGQQIELLRERQQALITAAVAGGLEVAA